MSDHPPHFQPFIHGGPGPQQAITRNLGPGQGPADHGDGSSDGAPGSTSPFEPEIADVLVAHEMLRKGLHLPPELVNAIIDYAEYWPHSTTEALYLEEYQKPFTALGSSPAENRFMFRCPPIGWTKPPRGGGLGYGRHESRPLPLRAEHLRDFLEKQIKGPRPALEHPVKKIVFTIKSRDQGWAASTGPPSGTYKQSWTWFQAGLERFDQSECSRDCPYGVASSQNEPLSLPICALRPICPPVVPTEAASNNPSVPAYKLDHQLFHNKRLTVQANKRACREVTEHRVVWSDRDDSDAVSEETAEESALTDQGRGTLSMCGEFVRNLKLGDVVTLWAMARFPGWRNAVDSARVDIYWAI